MRYQEMTDDLLLEHLKRGEKPAFEVIYHRYWRQLYSFSARQLGVREEAEEIVHDLMLSLWQNRAHSNIQNLRIYMFIAARNLINKNIKAQINLRKYLEYSVFREVSESSGLYEVHTKEELAAAVERAMRKMPEKTAAVFRMSKLEEVPVRRIAETLGLSDKAVEYHITKSVKMLRQHLQHFHFEN